MSLLTPPGRALFADRIPTGRRNVSGVAQTHRLPSVLHPREGRGRDGSGGKYFKGRRAIGIVAIQTDGRGPLRRTAKKKEPPQ